MLNCWWMLLENGPVLSCLSIFCVSKNNLSPPQTNALSCKPDSAHIDMSSDSWWDADSHSLIGFTNEDSGANKHLWNLTPVTQSTASIHSSLITFLPEPFLWSLILPQQTHHLFCAHTGAFLQKKKEAAITTSSQGYRGNTEGHNIYCAWQSRSWLSCVSPLDITHDIIL